MATSSVHALNLSKTKSLKGKVALPWNHKLVPRDTGPRRVAPSAYTQEMLQTTEERLANTKEVHPPCIVELLDMSETTHQKMSLVDVDQALFQPYPSELVFQNFTPTQTYKLPLLLFNNDKLSRNVKVELDNSPCFCVVGPDGVGSKVAPGMTTAFIVHFTPEEHKDYMHKLVCVTEREKFEVPVRAIGPRAILDFRDQLHLPVCPVKASMERSQLVRNIGNAEAKFQLHTQSPFSVTPSVGTLGVGESMQVTMAFSPQTTGNHSQDMLLHYHTGEDVYISLYGAAEELDVCLESDSVMLQKTYISLTSGWTVSLANRNGIPLRYCWKSCPSGQDGQGYTGQECLELQQQEEVEKDGFLSDPTELHRQPIPSRTFRDQHRRATEDHPAASHGCITIEPVEGEIWPNMSASFIIVFKPEEAKLYQHTVYCEVTGRESRLPLTIKGEGVGPKLQLDYDRLNMENVFIGDKDCYEVLVSNKGLIQAPFKLSCPDTTFGRCFSFSPEEGVIPPGDCQFIQVSFSSHTLGTFSEDLLLTATGQPQPLTVTFSGRVIGPTLNFNVSELNFGDVAFGFPHTLICTLFNTSLVPMTYTVRVLGDGPGPTSLTSTQQVSQLSRTNWRGAGDHDAGPAEFTLRPSRGTMRSMSDVTIEVTLCSNTEKSYQLALVVDVQGVGEEIMALPIYARCVVPELVVETRMLDFHRCFLGHAYMQSARLANLSQHLPASYGVLDQEYEESPSLLFGSSRPRGVIPPSGSVEVPLFLLAKALGRHQRTARIAVFGSAQPPLEVVLSCVGRGPTVHVQVLKLDFGKIPVLKDVCRTLLLVNQSPILACFSACMVHGRSPWRVEPSEGQVAPEGQLELRLIAHLKDTVPFEDKLQVAIQDSQTETVALTAIGTGTTIVSNLPFSPSLDLGTHFSQGPCQYHFTLTNLGQRQHRMYWANDDSPLFPSRSSGKSARVENGSERAFLPPIAASRQRKAPGRSSLVSSAKDRPVFTLSPSRAELFPGCSVDMVLSGSSDTPKVVHERLVCLAILGLQGSYDRIMTVDVSCRFVAPVLRISSKQLNFYTEKVAGETPKVFRQKLVLRNVSPLPLSMELSVVEPFSLCGAQGDPDTTTTKVMILGNGAEVEVWVHFNSAHCHDKWLQVLDEVLQVRYKEHPQQDMVALHAEFRFPNLHFSTTDLDFGCVLNGSETKREVTITNISLMPVSYQWAFLVDQAQHAISFAEKTEPGGDDGATGEPNWSKSTDPRAEPDSDSEVFKLSAKDEEDEEKRDPEFETKEGRGSPKEPPGVEEMFDICPLYGKLQPGDSQQVTFTFYSHAFMRGHLVAQCHVVDGPRCDVTLRGEASDISYSLDPPFLDIGLQMFDCVAEVELTLTNSGKVGFGFTVLLEQRQEEGGAELEEEEEGGVEGRRAERQWEDEENRPNGERRDGKEEGQKAFPATLRPGQPVVLPRRGYVEAGGRQRLSVFYLPGVPEVFHKIFQFQVSHLPPQRITLSGEGIFPRIRLDLPRELSEDRYAKVLQQATEAMEAVEAQRENLNDFSTTEGGRGGAAPRDNCILSYEELLHMEVERRLVKENALAVTSVMLESQEPLGSVNKWHKLRRVLLPEHVLDFGYVIQSHIHSHTIKVTNTGAVAVSFRVGHKLLSSTGFSTDFEKVKNLPCCETQAIVVKFDPQGANLPIGAISAVLSIQVVGGPSLQVRLCAVVTVPALTVSTDMLQFDSVQCSMCQVLTVQLFNHEEVPCSWSIAEEILPRKKLDKFTPLHLRKKILQEQQIPPVVFEMVPSSGLLNPSDRINIQVHFIPVERCAYSRRLVLSLAHSTQRVLILAEGKGEEPQLEFRPSVLELHPCLPFSLGEDTEVIVKNPCPFAVEFYSLEFDTQYHEEEKILRLMKDYETQPTLLLPPRAPGEALPAELLDHYKNHCSQPGANAVPADRVGEGCAGSQGMLETSPVSRAIGRHMGVDLSPEAVATRNRRGISIIVYGAPLTGKSTMAAHLARHYGAVCVNLDAVVADALSSGVSPSSLTARQLYQQATCEQAQWKAQEGGLAGQDPMGEAVVLSVEAVAKHTEEHSDDLKEKKPLFPEQLLADVLDERLQKSDCHRGVVIDGLESVHVQTLASSLKIILKALGNRRHIYVVDLCDSYVAQKGRERARRDAEEARQKEKEEREKRHLQEMDEEEYDALQEEEKERIIQRRLDNIKERKRRKLEEAQRERELEERRQREEEELKKKTKKGGKKDREDISGKKMSASVLDNRKMSQSIVSKDSPIEPAYGSRDGEDAFRDRRRGSMATVDEAAVEGSLLDSEDGFACSEAEIQLLCRFRAYEHSQFHLAQVLHYWDRVHGGLPPLPEEPPLEAEDVHTDKQQGHPHTPSTKKHKKERDNDKLEKERRRVDARLASPGHGHGAEVPAFPGVDLEPKPTSVPHIVLSVSERDHPSTQELLSSSLPPLDEVLDELGLGPSGPPIPPPVIFSVVPFPTERARPGDLLVSDHFAFLEPADEEKKDTEGDSHSKEGVPVVPVTPPPRGRGRRGAADKRRTPVSRRGARGAFGSRSPHPCTITPRSDLDHHEPGQRLTKFRWVVPANGEVTLRIWFHSDTLGQFDQTLNFELLGTKRRYQLFCRGLCTYPSICNDPTTMFALTKKVPRVEEGLFKAYVVKAGFYEFGPVLCGKSRDGYKEGRYPRNMEKLVIHNTSAMDAEVHFIYKHDAKATTYLLDPPSMTLKPDQKQELTIWAYPTKVGHIEDSLICCIKDNPEPVVIRISCWGVRPELEADPKHLTFERILLHRETSRTLTLYNKTALPAAWRLLGVQELGDDISVSQSIGVIPPKSSFSLHLVFRPIKPIFIKKALRLEVSDVEKILGVVHTDHIQITTEAYDVSLDINFPKGPGCLDYGAIRVFEEVNLSLTMKNNGKYEIGYRFLVERSEPSQPDLATFFTITPQQGSLMPAKKPTTVGILFRPSKEVCIREQPVLQCQVIEPIIGQGGETIAISPLKVTARACFSRYTIIPSNEINFGGLALGSKTSLTFNIENNGEFEYRFTIGRLQSVPLASLNGRGQGKKVPPENPTGKPSAAGAKVRRADSVHQEAGSTQLSQNRLTLGVFTVFPCSGVMLPGSQVMVTVECLAEQLGNWNECLAIDISDRDPADHLGGIPYRLLAQICVPAIVLDFASIFEEHPLCPSGAMLSTEPFRHADGVFVQDENKFVFNNVLVGRVARARFRFTNNSKVSCLLSLAVRPAGAKFSRGAEGFDLAPTMLTIQSQAHSFAVVTFTPQTMQVYQAVFEATIEGGTSAMTLARSKALRFDLLGEGNLPSVCVMRPTLKDGQGNPLLQFGRLLVGRRRRLPLVLRNDGSMPAQVEIDMPNELGVFNLNAAPGNTCSSIYSTLPEGTSDSEAALSQKASLQLSVGQQVEFEVSFLSEEPLSTRAKMTLQVQDNLYNLTVVHLAGEAYQDIISLDNLRGAPQDKDQDDRVQEGTYEVLYFEDCHVGRAHQEHFTMTNHCSSAVFRFKWPPPGPQISFSPQVGHLHAGCSKEVTVTFFSNEPVTLAGESVMCKICQVEFDQPTDQVPDWDDRHRAVHWIDASKPAAESLPAQPKESKVIKTDPEPPCSEVEDSQRELELRVSAVCDYAKFSCEHDPIRFTDTMLYQTRLHQLQMVNKGSVTLEYSWQVLMDDSGRRGVTPSSRPGSRAARAVTSIRPASALVSLTSLLMGDPDQPPFSVEPNIGLLAASTTQTFQIRFSPMAVAKYAGRLVCSIPNLEDEAQAACVSLRGRSLLPYCHFQLEDSDYVSKGRRSRQFRGPLDPNTRVIEFNSIGVSVTTTRRFGVANPTSWLYSYEWKCLDSEPGPFRCLTPSGSIQPGKSVEACLEYVAENPGLVESFWAFVIETPPVSFPFLLVGKSTEPQVYMDKAHLELGDVLVGRRVEETVYLVNAEELPFHFMVLQSSLRSEDQQQNVTLLPLTGTVAPRDRCPLSVILKPSRDGTVCFRPMVSVKGKTEPLPLGIKADGYTMNVCLEVQDSEGELREISPDQEDALDFGKVDLTELSTFTLLMSNLARFNLCVNFDIEAPRQLLPYLEVTPEPTAMVEVGQQQRSSLCFCPQSTCRLQDVRLLVKVKDGPRFTFAVTGRAVSPGLEFSFTKYNFGKCFLHTAGMMPSSQTLLISNKRDRGFSIQCHFQNTPYLEMGLLPHTVPPGGVIEVPLTFYPHEERRYYEKLTFFINECSKQVVDIFGQGIEMKLEVEDPSMRHVNMGSLLPGQKMKKQVSLVNRSPSDLTFSLQLSSQPPLDPKTLSFSPVGDLKLKAHSGHCVVELQWSPCLRMSALSAQLQAECMGGLHPLLTIQGCCQGVEVQLDRDYLAFGAVVQRCRASKKIVMSNTGDIGAKFQWETKDFPPDIIILPVSGYICPGADFPFDVTFAPAELCEARYENVTCTVEGFAAPIILKFTCSCIVPPFTKEVTSFTCPVRGSHTQTLTVSNPTDQRWSLKPVVEGEHWSVPPALIVEPYENKSYEITYRPMTMAAEGKRHLGSVFLSCPDGRGLLYSLHGTAEPPKPEATISHELTAKSPHTELLPVRNWLNKSQRFRVLIEMQKPERPDTTVSLKGLDYIEVPPLCTKEYKLSFFSYKQGLFGAKVTFRNEVCGEYLFYILSYKIPSTRVLSTVELVTNVRQTASASVELENPLTHPISLTADCKCLDVSVPPHCTVPALTKGVVSFDYHPLHPGDSTIRLTLHSNELAFFHYELILKALPPPPEKTIHLHTPLGGCHATAAKFLNYSRIKTEYFCKTDNAVFTVEKRIAVTPGLQAGSEVTVEVCFEPHHLGEEMGVLTVSSSAGGDYIFPLHGSCLPPRAQGPFSIKSGSSVNIPFKNVFLQTADFSFQVDNPCFSVKGVDTMRSKKTHNILVMYESPPPGGPQGPCVGKLIISSSRSEGLGQACSWVYYLKGENAS